MAEYIDKDAPVGILEAMSRSADCECIKKWIGKAAKRVSAIPAADVAPVVHGEWLLRHEGYGHYWECSVCHTNPCIYMTEHTKFCPNCGAKMDGAE